MINNLSSAAALYLAPILSFTSFLLALLVFLSPALTLHSQVALLVISPTPTAHPSGPFLFLGLLGSCSQQANSHRINCTTASFSANYDTSILPPNSNPDVLTSLPSTAPIAALVALIFLTLFFISFSLIITLAHTTKFKTLLAKPEYSRASAWLGFLGFMIGLTTYLVLRLWYGKMADDFNKGVNKQTSEPAQLTAEVSNAFTIIWVAHAFAAVPLICAMTKLHMTATPSGKA